jgi:hypothetical protein
MADDRGLLLWRPEGIGAALYPYDAMADRETDLARRAVALVAAGLLVIHACGCATLPRFGRDLAQSGGTKAYAVSEFHETAHGAVAASRPEPATDMSVHVRTNQNEYGPIRHGIGIGIGIGEGSGEGPGGGTPEPLMARTTTEPDRPVDAGLDGRLTLTRDSSSADVRVERPGDDPLDRMPGRPDLEALFRRGWQRVTMAQRKILDEINDRHDRAWSATILAATPAHHDPLEALMAADTAWQVEAKGRAEREERDWARVKAEEATAVEALTP